MGSWEVVYLLRFPVALCHKKSVLELLRAIKVEILDFSLRVRSCLLESRKLLIVPPKGFCSQT